MSQLDKGIRIESDGTIQGTKVINLETGKEMSKVVCVDIRLQPGYRPVMATLEVFPEEIDITVPGPFKQITERYENS